MGHDIGSAGWMRERFPEKDWHHHRRTDGGLDLCDGTPADCSSKPKLPVEVDDEQRLQWQMRAHNLAGENELLRRLVRFLHPDPTPDPASLRLAREELGEYGAVLLVEIVGDRAGEGGS